MAERLLLTGFEPFGGERMNPSWAVAHRFEGQIVGGLRISALRLPVNSRRAVALAVEAIRSVRPAAVLGLGQAGGRPAVSLERVAVNLVDADRKGQSTSRERPVVRGGPDAYFSRLPLAGILRALHRRGIPASYSMSAGLFICNAVMYATLHELQRRHEVPAGFIHLPYDARQATRHRDAPSMTLAMMEDAVAVALAVVARAAS